MFKVTLACNGDMGIYNQNDPNFLIVNAKINNLPNSGFKES